MISIFESNCHGVGSWWQTNPCQCCWSSSDATSILSIESLLLYLNQEIGDLEVYINWSWVVFSFVQFYSCFKKSGKRYPYWNLKHTSLSWFKKEKQELDILPVFFMFKSEISITGSGGLIRGAKLWSFIRWQNFEEPQDQKCKQWVVSIMSILSTNKRLALCKIFVKYALYSMLWTRC